MKPARFQNRVIDSCRYDSESVDPNSLKKWNGLWDYDRITNLLAHLIKGIGIEKFEESLKEARMLAK